VPPCALLKVERISSFLLKGDTGTDLPLHRSLGSAVSMCPGTILEQHEKEILNKIRG